MPPNRYSTICFAHLSLYRPDSANANSWANLFLVKRTFEELQKVHHIHLNDVTLRWFDAILYFWLLVKSIYEGVRYMFLSLGEDEHQSASAYLNVRVVPYAVSRKRTVSPFGLRLVEKLGDVLDLIVSDIKMPNGDGLTFVCSVRELLPVLPIILMSAYAEPERQENPSTSFEFLQKPFFPPALLKAVENAKKNMKLRTQRELQIDAQ